MTDRARELGVRNEDLGTIARALFDGAFVGDYKLEGEAIDLVVVPTNGRLDYKEQLADVPIATPAGPIVPVASVVDFEYANAPQSIQRIEELPAVTVQIRPPEGVPI